MAEELDAPDAHDQNKQNASSLSTISPWIVPADSPPGLFRSAVPIAPDLLAIEAAS
jgi:hypothetical protein